MCTKKKKLDKSLTNNCLKKEKNLPNLQLTTTKIIRLFHKFLELEYAQIVEISILHKLVATYSHILILNSRPDCNNSLTCYHKGINHKMIV